MEKPNKNFSPILVVGTGRCGTSKTAKLLGEIGVFMGDRFRNEAYEDLDFKEPTDQFLDGKIVFNHWYEYVANLSRIRANKLAWGFKDPRICSILGLYLPLYVNPIFIRCRRKHEDTVKSMVNNTDWSYEDAKKIEVGRNIALDKILVGQKVFEVDFTNKVDEDDLKQKLKNAIQDFHSDTIT